MVIRAVATLALLWTVASTAGASEKCTSVRIQGCGRKARICVKTSSNTDAEQRALKAFKEQYRCVSPTVTSYSSSCSESANDRCDLKL